MENMNFNQPRGLGDGSEALASEAPEVPVKAKDEKGIVGKFAKKVAMLGVAGMSIFGGQDSALAEGQGATNDSAGAKSRPESYSHKKGSSLGKFYENQFSRNEKKNENLFARAKEILTKKNVDFSEKSKIEIVSEGGIPTEVTVDGEVYVLSEADYLPEEVEIIKAARSAREDSGSSHNDKTPEARENNEAESKPKVETKTTVSGAAAEFL